MTSDSQVSAYSALFDITSQMCAAVTDDNWEGLVVLHDKYERLVQALIATQKAEDNHALTDEDHRQIRGYITHINENLSQLQPAILARQQQLIGLIDGMVNQHSKMKSYYQVAELI